MCSARSILNAAQLERGLAEVATGHGLRTRVVSLEQLDTRQQLRVVRSSKALLGIHGAGLTWSIFLRESAVLAELLPSAANRVHYFANQAAWLNRSYGSWQNFAPTNEARANDTAGHPMGPFHNQLTVDVPVIAALLRDLLSGPRGTVLHRCSPSPCSHTM